MNRHPNILPAAFGFPAGKEPYLLRPAADKRHDKTCFSIDNIYKNNNIIENINQKHTRYKNILSGIDLINRMKRCSAKCHTLPIYVTAWCIFNACGNPSGYDTTGVFETVETLVLAEVSGKVEKLELKEGRPVVKDQQVGYIDSMLLYQKKMQLLATQKAMFVRRPDVAQQLALLQEQIDRARAEKASRESMFAGGVADQNQVEEANSQLLALKSSADTLTRPPASFTGNDSVFNFQINLINAKLKKCRIINPADGMVIKKYAREKDLVTEGFPLYKVADARHMFLKVYLTQKQTNEVTASRKMTVRLTMPDGSEKLYDGEAAWISDKAEPLMQDKDELLYAVKIAVDNTDGFIKTGMYGNVKF
jgi:HlyD family secretion protein